MSSNSFGKHQSMKEVSTYLKSPVHQRIPPIRKNDLLLLRLLILITIILLIQFGFWYFNPDHIGHKGLFWLLTISFGYKVLHLFYEWFYFASMKAPKSKKPRREWTVDILTTYVAGEPYDMIEQTLRAMIAVKYPHQSILCDESDDPYLKELCAELGVTHVYRGEDKTGAKAGNINYALENVATGDLCVIFDPDHVPVPEFLDRVIFHFEDPSVGYVQSIQGYSNFNESFFAKGAAEQTYLFYGPIMLGANRHGTVQAIGANCIFRRKALDSIGGHASGLCEDTHTSMQLHAKKWTSVYVPELLTRGRVPSTLSAYYKQQLKWSRGSFELLFKVFPKLFRKFTWRQRLHYFLTPLYFLYGAFGLIDLGVPIVSLLSFYVPLYIQFTELIFRVLPLLIGIFLIRQFAQHYVLDKYETGLHITGGILRVATWWVYLLGFLYTLIQIKVPYLPTPKKSKFVNDWRNSIPNILVILLSFFAIGYSLKHDFNPYTIIMSSFAAFNILVLGIVVIQGQQLITNSIRRLFPSKLSIYANRFFQFRRDYAYRFIRNHYVTLIAVFIVIGLSSHNYYTHLLSALHPLSTESTTKKLGWHLLSQESRFPLFEDALCNEYTNYCEDVEQRMVKSYRIRELDEQTLNQLSQIFSTDQFSQDIPLINWQFFSAFSENYSNDPQEKELEHIRRKSVERIQRLAQLIREYQRPVMLCMDLEKSSQYLSNLVDFDYHDLIDLIKNEGAGNVTNVWKYSHEGKKNYPGKHYVDLVLISEEDSSSLSIVSQFISDSLNHPLLLSFETSEQSDKNQGILNQLLTSEFQIQGLLGHYNDSLPFSRAEFDNDFSRIEKHSASDEKTMGKNSHDYRDNQKLKGNVFDLAQPSKKAQTKSDSIRESPLPIKGVVYNPEQDWQDGRWPLTRRRLLEDLFLIKEMGANAISREKPTIYDKNILQVAEELDLKVQYGFWLDPSIDYLKDTARLQKVSEQVHSIVRKYKESPAILSWNLGNTTWNKLNHYFHQPYLSAVRLAYVEFIEHLTQQIKRIDNLHPVLTTLDSRDDFQAALDDYLFAAPSIDFLALNAFDELQFKEAIQLFTQSNQEHFYMINGFGIKTDQRHDDTQPYTEMSSFEKARYYSKFWTEHVAYDENNNLGGFVYCWRDRIEGTITLSGITDNKGRLKPTYYALKQVWTGENQNFSLGDIRLKIVPTPDIVEDLIIRVESLYNEKSTLTYEWQIWDGELLVKQDHVRINYERMGPWWFSLVSNYRQHVLHRIYPEKMGNEIRFPKSKVQQDQRVYLYIYNDTGHVVTASVPLLK